MPLSAGLIDAAVDHTNSGWVSVGAVAGAAGGEEPLLFDHPLLPELRGAGEGAVAGEAARQP